LKTRYRLIIGWGLISRLPKNWRTLVARLSEWEITQLVIVSTILDRFKISVEFEESSEIPD